MLSWWEVWGSYAWALVAADSVDRAVELVREHPEVPDREWALAEPADHPVPPAPPTVEGVYGWFAE